jgi:hypothetical protein
MPVRRSYVHSLIVLLSTLMWSMPSRAQVDTAFGTVMLAPAVVRAVDEGFDLEGFMHQVRTDTTFHKAFLNTRYYPNRLKGVLVVRNKKDRETASQVRAGRLVRTGKAATWEQDSLVETGPLRDRKGGFRYLTAELYDDLFFPRGSFVPSNSVAARRNEPEPNGRIARYKNALKKFMFDPGSDIQGMPLVGGKLALFDPDMAPLYDFALSDDVRNGRSCWLFTATAKPDFRDGRTVIKDMRTWFDQESGDVIARHYRIAGSSLILDFDIGIRVENRRMGNVLVPVAVDYDGDWDIPLRKREVVRFTLIYTDWEVR